MNSVHVFHARRAESRSRCAISQRALMRCESRKCRHIVHSPSRSRRRKKKKLCARGFTPHLSLPAVEKIRPSLGMCLPARLVPRPRRVVKIRRVKTGRTYFSPAGEISRPFAVRARAIGLFINFPADAGTRPVRENEMHSPRNG